MKKTTLIFCLFYSLYSLGAVNVSDCNSYGPNERSLAVLIDDEDFSESTGLSIGYTVQDSYFSFVREGCNRLIFSNQELLCDGKVVGVLGEKINVISSGGYQSVAYEVSLDEGVYEVSGSCQRSKRLPLTISFR